jgi:hypothetical protein
MHVQTTDDMNSENISACGPNGEFMSDNELAYMQRLKDNEALLEYYATIKEGLTSLFIQAKISDGRYKIDGATSASDALKLAGEIIPEVGGILVKVSEIMEWHEEKNITEKLKKISALVPDESRTFISESVASKLTIKRRNFIQNLKMDELKF